MRSLLARAVWKNVEEDEDDEILDELEAMLLRVEREREARKEALSRLLLDWWERIQIGADKASLVDALARGGVLDSSALLFGGDAAGILNNVFDAVEVNAFDSRLKAMADEWARLRNSGFLQRWQDYVSSFRVPVPPGESRRLQPLFRTWLERQNPRALDVVRANAGHLVREVDDETRRAIRQIIEDELADGINPRTLVTRLVGEVQPDGSRLGGALGINRPGATALENYRRGLTQWQQGVVGRAEAELRSGQFGAFLTRRLRDKRFDRTLARMQRAGGALTEEQITHMVNRYAANWLRYRAETIARTESIRALAEGRRLAWDKAVMEGELDPRRIFKRWVTSRDERVREEHRLMEGVMVGYDEEFVLPSGETTWGPPHSYNCRCVCWIRPEFFPAREGA